MSGKEGAGPFKAALCQMCSGEDVGANLKSARALLDEAAARGASLACLPELFPCMGADVKAKERAAEEPGKGPVQDFLSETSREFGIRIAAGSILVRGKSKLLNRSLLYDDQGRAVASYDKIHLFRYRGPDREYDESAEYEAGSGTVFADTDLGRVGLSVCYDLRFPELYRALGGAAVILVPSAFTRSTGKAHWELLVRTRAVENQCYVLAAAQCGEHPGGIRTWGHSLAADPWGQVVAALDDEPGVAVVDVDPGLVESCRTRLPALDNRVL